MTTKPLSERLADKRTETSTPSVSRRDISLYEEQRPTYTGFETQYWVADLSGRLSTGEDVSLSRTGTTSAEALEALNTAITDQGWRIR